MIRKSSIIQEKLQAPTFSADSVEEQKEMLRMKQHKGVFYKTA
jgi:hypothetical protein